MNQRREARFDASQSVWVTIYGPVDLRVPGFLRNVSGRGAGLEVGQAIGTGTAIRIDVGDSMLLGEAIYCREEENGFYVGVELEHALHGLVELGRIVGQFSEEASRSELPHAVYDADGQH